MFGWNAAPSHFLKNSNASLKIKTMEEKGVGVRSLVHNTSRVEGLVRTSGWGLGRVTSGSIIHMDLHKFNNKLISAWLEHFWCMNKLCTYIDSQDSPWPGFGGSHHLLPYSILYD
jgi:hypothetical protein